MSLNHGLVAFITGMIGLTLQILAGRLLTPQFGSSVYTWGSIIGIFMIALALGYYFGGKQSTHANQQSITIRLHFLTFFILFLIYTNKYVLAIPSFLPSKFSAIPAIILLFGPITFLIGSLAPILISLTKKNHKGEASGHIFTMDTVGSIVGTFGATFFLIPNFTLTTSFIIVGILSIAISLYANTSWKHIVISMIMLIILVFSYNVQAASLIEEGDLVYKTQTAYQELEVRDINSIRVLYLNGGMQSAYYLNNPDSYVFRYSTFFDLPFEMTNVSSALFIGGGGFTGPKEYIKRNVTVDVIELDQDVVDTAVSFFEVDLSTMDVAVGDGRQLLSDKPKLYDVIVIDAYRKDRVPFHMTTQEFYEIVYSKLSQDGVLISNVISAPDGDASLFYRTMFKTIDSVFDQTYAFHTDNSNRVQNIEIIATKSKNRITAEEFSKMGQDLQANTNLYLSYTETTDVDILTDEKAPVDTILESLTDLDFILE